CIRGCSIRLNAISRVINTPLVASRQRDDIARAGSICPPSVLSLIVNIADVKCVRQSKASAWQSIPIRNRCVMLVGIVEPAVLHLNACVSTKRHRVGEEKTIGGLDSILSAHRRCLIGRTNGMADEWKSHRLATPIVTTTRPLLRAGALCLRCLAVIEEETWI